MSCIQKDVDGGFRGLARVHGDYVFMGLPLHCPLFHGFPNYIH